MLGCWERGGAGGVEGGQEACCLLPWWPLSTRVLVRCDSYHSTILCTAARYNVATNVRGTVQYSSVSCAMSVTNGVKLFFLSIFSYYIVVIFRSYHWVPGGFGVGFPPPRRRYSTREEGASGMSVQHIYSGIYIYTWMVWFVRSRRLATPRHKSYYYYVGTMRYCCYRGVI